VAGGSTTSVQDSASGVARFQTEITLEGQAVAQQVPASSRQHLDGICVVQISTHRVRVASVQGSRVVRSDGGCHAALGSRARASQGWSAGQDGDARAKLGGS
jgi:hypothetical protein